MVKTWPSLGGVRLRQSISMKAGWWHMGDGVWGLGFGVWSYGRWRQAESRRARVRRISRTGAVVSGTGDAWVRVMASK
jgi:hypothetical protein